MDRIHISNLNVRCHIGATARERKSKQRILLDITLYSDLRRSRIQDNLSSTVDYSVLSGRIIEAAQESEFRLIESMAEMVSSLCLEHPLVMKVTVGVFKPGAIRAAKGASVEITRPES